MSELLDQASVFFRQYGQIFDTGDMAKFASFFNEPFVSVRADGQVQSMPTNQDARRFFSFAMTSWKKEGYSSFRARDLAVTPIGERSMLVTLTWDMLDDRGHLIRDWRQSYNLVLRGDAWKVIASTYHQTDAEPG